MLPEHTFEAAEELSLFFMIVRQYRLSLNACCKQPALLARWKTKVGSTVSMSGRHHAFMVMAGILITSGEQQART